MIDLEELEQGFQDLLASALETIRAQRTELAVKDGIIEEYRRMHPAPDAADGKEPRRWELVVKPCKRCKQPFEGKKRVEYCQPCVPLAQQEGRNRTMQARLTSEPSRAGGLIS